MQLGALPRHNTTDNGISPEQLKLSENAWSEICSITNDYKQLYRAFIPTGEIRLISTARRVIELPSFKTPGLDVASADNGANFSSLTFCKNAHTNVHVDSDMCQGLIVVHKPGVHYIYRQHILAYFCF